MSDLAQFKKAYPIEVRFGDLDAMGHVNNAKFLTYLEQARINYYRDVIDDLPAFENFQLILARVECDFRAPIHYPGTVQVYVRTSRLGSKSFDLEYIIMTDEGVVAAAAVTVLVCYDYQRGHSIPMPDDWRARVLQFEPGLNG